MQCVWALLARALTVSDMENNMTNYELIKKVIGEIRPIGETNEDNRRFENLIEYADLTCCMVQDLMNMVAFKNNHQGSMMKADGIM